MLSLKDGEAGTVDLSIYSNARNQTFNVESVEVAFDNTSQHGMGAVADSISGSEVIAGSVIGANTELTSSGSGEVDAAAVTVTGGTLTSGSILMSGTTLGIGTQLESVTTAITLGAGTILGEGTTLGSGTGLNAGTVMGAGTVLGSGASIGSGTVLGGNIKTSSGAVLTAASGDTNIIGDESRLLSGTTISSGSILADGQALTISGVGGGGSQLITGDGTSTVNSLSSSLTSFVVDGDQTLNVNGITENTYLSNDVTASDGTIYTAGTILQEDITTKGETAITNDMTLQNGSVLKQGSTLAANNENSTFAEAVTSDGEVNRLSDVNVLTMEGAQQVLSLLQ